MWLSTASSSQLISIIRVFMPGPFEWCATFAGRDSDFIVLLKSHKFKRCTRHLQEMTCLMYEKSV